MILPNWVSESELKALVLEEKQSSYVAIKPKRDLFLDREALYANITDQTGKIYNRLIRSVTQTLLSLYYTDEISVSFSGRQLWDDEIADTYDNLAKFDHEEMGMDKLNYSVQMNRLIYWVGIRVFDHWDSFRKVPVYKSINPLSWYPDPNAFIDNHRFHGFDMEVRDVDLTNDIYSNLDKIKSVKAQELEDADRRRKETRELQEEVENEVNPVYHVYNHYTHIKWDKYLVTLANGGDLVIRCEKLEAVYEEEKKGNMEVPFPVILNFYEPKEGDPFGICIPDVLADKQMAEQFFQNLNRIKAENEALGDLFLVDTNAIRNVNDLKLPKQWPKYIKADLSRNANPIKEVEKARIKPDAINIPNMIREQASEDVGLDPRSLGVSTPWSVTATENQRVQRNSNLKLVLGNKINQWGEKALWVDWMRRYYEHFDLKSEKNIKLNNAFWNTLITVKKQDLMTSSDIDIKVINKSQEDELREKEKAGLMVIAELVLQDPDAARISKLYVKRSLARVNGISKEQRSVIFADPIEADAREHLQLLNNNIEIEGDIDPNEDHLTYLIVYERAIDTEAKHKAIEMRKGLWFQQQLLNGSNNKVEWGWAAANIALNNMMQQPQEQWASSLADVNTQ